MKGAGGGAGQKNERLGRTERARRQTQEFILKHPRAGEMRRELEEAVLAAEPAGGGEAKWRSSMPDAGAKLQNAGGAA